MDWSTIGSIGEFVGAFGVIGSLIYLALQVRAGSKTLFTAMRESTFNSLKEFNYNVVSDPDLAWIFQEGCKDYSVLDEKEKARYVHLMFTFFKMFENIYLHYKDNLVSEQVWKSNSHIFKAYGTLPGAKQYWNIRRPIFDPVFREMVDEINSEEIPIGQSDSGMDLPDLVNQ